VRKFRSPKAWRLSASCSRCSSRVRTLRKALPPTSKSAQRVSPGASGCLQSAETPSQVFYAHSGRDPISQDAGLESEHPGSFIPHCRNLERWAYVGDTSGDLCHIQTGKGLGGHSRAAGSYPRLVAALALYWHYWGRLSLH